MKFSVLSDWLNYIEMIHSSNIALGLQRLSTIAKKMDLMHFDCPVILVGGTNGKGSCVRLLERIYSEAGYYVGAYTSPHLFRFNERIRMGENEIDDLTLMKSFEAIEQAREGQPLTFFEFTTLSALHFYKKAQPDLLILEIGLGGRLDAVNVVEPDLSIVVTVDIDHCDWLGNTREAIGFEKAGIFRRHKPAIYGDLKPPKSILHQAKKIETTLCLLDQDYGFTRIHQEWEWWTLAKSIKELPLPLLKIENAATALMAVDLLQSRISINREAICEGISTAKLPGRFEQVFFPVPCIFDVAHNPQAARNLVATLDQLNFSGKTFAVIGMLEDKEIQETILPLLPWVDTWFVADLSVPRGAKAENILKYLREYQTEKCYHFTSVKEAMESAIRACFSQEEETRILVFGSFYTVAEAKQWVLAYSHSNSKNEAMLIH